MKICIRMITFVHVDLSDHLFYMFADYGSEVDHSLVTPDSSIHTEVLGSQQTGSPSSVHSLPVTETHLASIQESPANYTQDFTSASQSNIKQVCVNVFCSFFIDPFKSYVP